VCGDGELNVAWYSYLLGMYLGDGCLTEHQRGVYSLRITLDLRYGGIIDECRRAILAVRNNPEAKVGKSLLVGCVQIGSYWKHWPCLFPQHGAGPKHLRKIELEPWQQEIADAHPDRLLRGLIHSDGCRFVNRVNGKGYLRYQFRNNSEDIRRVFCRACDVYGVSWKQSYWNTISVSRGADVRRLDLSVGPKE
jgi:hypothetical protein